MTVAVQVGPVLLLVQELLTIMLAVNVQKLTADLPQLGHRHRLSVDAAGVFAVGVDLPLEEQLPLLRDQGQLRQGREGRYSGKYRADKGLGSAGADQVPAGALTQHRAQSIDDDALPRAGLAGEGVKAGAEGDVCLLDDGDILNVQKMQHISFLPVPSTL